MRGAAPPSTPGRLSAASSSVDKPTPHPAKFNANVLTVMRHVLRTHLEPRKSTLSNVLDPFGGVGGVHELRTADIETWCIELEYEWAHQAGARGWVWYGDFFEFNPDSPFYRWDSGNTVFDLPPKLFDAIATSPTYGNRMSDHHNARDTSTRITYKHKLGRDLSPNNSGMMRYGNEYKRFHIRAYNRFRQLLVPGGLVLLNVSDFVRDGQVVQASKWHHCRMLQFGYTHVRTFNVPTQRMGMGANREARVECEQLHVYRA